MTTAWPILGVFTGQIAPLGDRQRPSAIARTPHHGLIRVTRLGLTGDHHGDPEHHGGPHKALHHYPADHYATWRAELPPDTPALGAPAPVGENLSTLGLTEPDVCLRDLFRLGTALVQVTQSRQPCWKLSARFGVSGLARRFQTTGRTGWYYRVLEEGHLQAGDTLTLHERPEPSWPLSRVHRALYLDPLDRSTLEALSSVPDLPPDWQRMLQRRLDTHQVEDWAPRLGEDLPPHNL
jgi:MOSC domain-containing protein YiiM